MMSVARELGKHCVFIGAFRGKELRADDVWEGTPVRRVGVFFPPVNGKHAATYLKGVVRFWVGAARELVRQRPSFVHVSDFEAGLACAAYCTVTGTPLIYNIHDNLSVRYAVPSTLAYVLNVLEGGMVLWSDVSLVPEAFRQELLPAWCRYKVVVIRNTPIDMGERAAPEVASRANVVFAGWLDRGRAIEQMLELARRKEINLVVAGEGDAALVIDIPNIPAAKYLGYLNHGEIMEETAKAHFVAAFYDPVRPINRYAASNKIAEALSIGRPVLINSEMLVARELEEAGCAVVLPYSELPELPKRIAELFASGRYAEMCKNARAHYERAYKWSRIHDRTVEVYRALGLQEVLPREAEANA